MITISVCMIVKNEEKILKRCLESLKDIADEFVIVDTGSVDNTKKIALEYTKKVYDYQWINDFADARNFSFSKAEMEYIYTADADEILDEKNIQSFKALKSVLLPDIEIVQMLYTNQLHYGTTYNFEKEYRPKLFKRLRQFTWINPIHETVNIEPVIYNSEIEIIHMPQESHANRDFKNILNVIKRGDYISKSLYIMYAKELFIAGEDKDFADAKEYFEKSIKYEQRSEDELRAAQCVLTKAGRITKDFDCILKNSLKNFALKEAASEVCFEIGEYFYEKNDFEEALIWFYNAAYETSAELNIHYSGDYPLLRISQCYERLNMPNEAKQYDELAKSWILPQSDDVRQTGKE